MDLNVVVISGRLAAKPETRILDGGSTLIRYLVIARAEEPRRRTDVVPAVQWNPPEWTADLVRGDCLWLAGAVQRRFWSDDQSRRGCIEVVAHHVERRSNGADADFEPSVLGMVEGVAEV